MDRDFTVMGLTAAVKVERNETTNKSENSSDRFSCQQVDFLRSSSNAVHDVTKSEPTDNCSSEWRPIITDVRSLSDSYAKSTGTSAIKESASCRTETLKFFQAADGEKNKTKEDENSTCNKQEHVNSEVQQPSTGLLINNSAVNDLKLAGILTTVAMVATQKRKEYSCQYCGDRFPQLRPTQLHVLTTHHGKKPFECPHCPKLFLRKIDIETHLRRHLGETPHECPLCDKKFAFSSALKLHSLTHSDAKPYKCQLCDKQFARRCYVYEHSRRMHALKKPFGCQNCYKTFASKAELRSHAERRHDVIIETRQKTVKLRKVPIGEQQPVFTTQTDSLPPSAENHSLFVDSTESHSKYSKCFANVELDVWMGDKSDRTDEILPSGAMIKIQDSSSETTSWTQFSGSCKSASTFDFNFKSESETTGSQQACMSQTTDGNCSLGDSNVEPVYMCENCDMKLSAAGELQRHSLTHDVKASYECEECRTMFTDYGQLLWHMLAHAQEKCWSAS